MLKPKKIKPGGLEYKEKVASIDRVTKVTKGGRAFRFRALVIVGNEKGVIGYGVGKDKETTGAIYKAVERAKKNLVQVNLINDTIPYQCEAKYDGARIFMKPASEGTGIIAGGTLRSALEVVGIKNILSKSKGSSNPYSVIIATIKALSKMRNPIQIAKARGISLEEVFNGVK